MADSETKEQKKAAKAQAKADKKAEKEQAKEGKSKGGQEKPFSAGRRMLSMLYWLIMISVLIALGWQGFIAYELFSGSK